LVAFLDSDDIWGRDVLSLHYSAHDTARVGISYGSYQTIDTQGRVIGRFSPPAQVDIESMLKSCDIGLLTACVNRKVAGDFSFPETPKEDYALWVVLLQRPGVTAVRVSGLQCYYRIRSGSVSSNKTAEIFRQWKVIRAYGNCGPWSALVNIVFYGLKGLKKNILDYRRSR
jgi:hypothetical protein